MIKQKSLWRISSLALVAAGIGLLSAPARWEGAVLFPISPGHALSVLDTLALVHC